MAFLNIEFMKFFLFLIFFLPTWAFAQDFFSFLSPKAPGTSIELEGLYLPDKYMDGGNDNTQVLFSSVGVSQKVYEEGKNSVVVGGKYQKLDINARNPLLHDYYNIQGSVAFRRMTDDNKFWSTSLSYGAASDKPFKNGRDSTIGVNYLQQFNSKWFGVLNYSNNRPFLNNIPLPGFFYIHEMSRERALIVGFPMVYWMTPITNDFSFRLFALGPWAYKARVLYTSWKFILPYIGLDQTPQTFFRHDRDERTDRFFWFERKAALGVEGFLKGGIRYDLSTGLAFDRQFFEARNQTEKKNFLLNMENSYFVGLTIRYNF